MNTIKQKMLYALETFWSVSKFLIVFVFCAYLVCKLVDMGFFAEFQSQFQALAQRPNVLFGLIVIVLLSIIAFRKN